MVAFLLLFYLMNTPQVKSVYPQSLIQSVYSSTHRLLHPNLTMGHMCLIWEWEKGWLISKNYTAVTSSLCPIFTTSSFIKKAAISKGIWSTCKGFVSFFLFLTNKKWKFKRYKESTVVNNKKLRCIKVSVLQPHKAYLGDYFHSNFIQGFKHF